MTGLSGSGKIVLRYDYVKTDSGEVDVGTFAITKGRTITFNKFMYDDSDYLSAEYADAVETGGFAKGTTYLNVPDHECGHIFTRYDKRYFTELQRVCDDRALKSGISRKDYIEAHIAAYASYSRELSAEINSMRYGSCSSFALNMLKEAGLV